MNIRPSKLFRMAVIDIDAREAASREPDGAAPVACFSVLIGANPSATLKVLDIFARCDLIPS